MQPITILREHLTRLLTWHGAHADFESAVADMPASLRGVTPPGLPYSPWRLLEHIRLAQADILAFCTHPDYREGKWPDDYWPPSAAPPTEEAWAASIAAYRRDLAQLRNLINDEGCDPFAKVPVGNGQTFLREFLLVADHTAYHVGQLVAVRRLLGAWSVA
jgi:DinB superfamily